MENSDLLADYCSKLINPLSVKTSDGVWKDHRDKIKPPNPVVKDLISNKL